MTRLCRLVLPLALLAGCYDEHGLGPDAGAGTPPDATSAPLDAPPTPPDGLFPRDVAVAPDAPSGCPLARADASCLESFAIQAGRAFELPFQYDGCGCCVATSCDVSVDAASRTLRLATGLCADPCDCDACITPRGTCAVPPLPVSALGQWTVEVNGTVAFGIGVVDASDPTATPAPPGCATYAERDECGGAVPDLTTGPVRGAICVEVADRAERRVLRLHATCWSCGMLDSACDALLLPRFTDELPPGADIQLHARDYATACDVDCPGVCLEHVRECDFPRLEAGSYYRVFVDGEEQLAFVEGEPSRPCASGG